MERNPHSLFEGCLIGCWAIRAKVAYIYIRGEFYHVQRVMEAELAKAYAQGYAGKNIMGSGFDCDIVIHRGAGAYEAGEETALIESLEGKRAQPRIKPPFPAVSGLYNCPTAVNNVETLCNLPPILLNGAEWFARLGPEKNGGPKLFCVSGHVKKPGTYEASMHTTLRELIYDYAGGIRDGHQLKAVIPGGSSVPILLPDQLDVPASFDDVAEGGFDARLRRHHRHGRDHLHGLAGAEPALFLQTRILRQVHAMPRGERLAVPDPDPHRERRRSDARYRPAGQRRGKHRRQDLVRVWRRRRHAGVDDGEALPPRVRGARPRRALHAAGRLAGAEESPTETGAIACDCTELNSRVSDVLHRSVSYAIPSIHRSRLTSG